MTQIDHNGNRILLTLLAELEVFGEAVLVTPPADNIQLATVQHFGIPYQPARWFGGSLNATRRKDYSRAAHRLEHRGLVTCLRKGRRNRVRYLRPTPTGLRRALQLVDADVDLQQLAQAFAWINWAEDLWNEVYSDLVR